jgi:hypothetical protein
VRISGADQREEASRGEDEELELHRELNMQRSARVVVSCEWRVGRRKIYEREGERLVRERAGAESVQNARGNSGWAGANKRSLRVKAQLTFSQSQRKGRGLDHQTATIEQSKTRSSRKSGARDKRHALTAKISSIPSKLPMPRISSLYRSSAPANSLTDSPLRPGELILTTFDTTGKTKDGQ